MALELLQFIRDYIIHLPEHQYQILQVIKKTGGMSLIRSIQNQIGTSNTNNSMAIKALPFQITEDAFLTCRMREFQMAAPEFMKDRRKSSQLVFCVHNWLQLVYHVSRHDTSKVYET